MATNTAEITLRVQRPSGEDEALTEIARVSFGEQGELTLLGTSTGFESALENILSAVNAQAELNIKVPPPPEAEPRSLYRRTVKRDEPDLLEVLCDYMEQKYDLFLAPEPAFPEAAAAAPALIAEPPQPVSPMAPAPAPAAAVAPPAAPSPPSPSPLELLRAAAAREDPAAVQQHLLTLGVDRKACERLLAAWEAIITPGNLAKQRVAKMQELIAVIRSLTALRPVQDELWRLQKMLTKYT